MKTNNTNFYMEEAIKEACLSGKDLPIGCIIVDKDGKIIAKGHNQKENHNDVTAHAEIVALRMAGEKLGNWRLKDCVMYVTLEPCPMCAWAILNARISKLYFGSYDALYGAFASKMDLRNFLSTPTEVFGGILEDECENLLKEYFEKLR